MFKFPVPADFRGKKHEHSVFFARYRLFFPNLLNLFFIVLIILKLFNIINEMVWIAIFILTGVVYYIVRSYLENDAMVKAKYVAEDYMKSSNLLTDEEITHVLNKYEEINKIGVKLYLYRLILEVLIRTLIFSIICIF